MARVTEAAAVLARAAAAAGAAPSVFNTQPWRWRVYPEWLDLHADRSRQLVATDPEGRLLGISCGVALHHARVALEADGWRPDVTHCPDRDDPDHVARIRLAGRMEVTSEAVRLYQAVQVRRSDRRPVVEVPVPDETLAAVRAAVEEEQVHLHVLPPDQVHDLSVAASRADELHDLDDALRDELTYWSGGRRETGTGVPSTAIPAEESISYVPQRDFRAEGSLWTAPGSDRCATYAMLFGPHDTWPWWIRGGEALSAAWLVAVVHGVSLLPFSAPIEVPATRTLLRTLLVGTGHPYLVVRLGLLDPDQPAPPPTPRLPTCQTVEIVE